MLLQGIPEVVLRAQEDACATVAFQASKTLLGALGRDQEVQGLFLIHVGDYGKIQLRCQAPWV